LSRCGCGEAAGKSPGARLDAPLSVLPKEETLAARLSHDRARSFEPGSLPCLRSGATPSRRPICRSVRLLGDNVMVRLRGRRLAAKGTGIGPAITRQGRSRSRASCTTVYTPHDTDFTLGPIASTVKQRQHDHGLELQWPTAMKNFMGLVPAGFCCN
jgi:hypothetical protein